MQARTSAQQTGVDVRLALKCLSTPMTCDSVTTHSKLMTGHETQSYQAVGRSAGPVYNGYLIRSARAMRGDWPLHTSHALVRRWRSREGS